MKRAQHGLATLISCLCSALVGSAADAGAPPQTAAKHVERGMQLYRSGDLDASLAELARAHELWPNPVLLFNMAQVQLERHEYVRALRLLQRYLDTAGDELSAERRAEVERQQARVRQRVALLAVSVNASHAALFVNDERVATLPLQHELELNPGVVRVRVEAKGYSSYTQTLNVAGGDRVGLDVQLEARPGTATTSEPVLDHTPVWISGVTAGALGIGAVTFSLLGASADDRLDAARSRSPTDAAAVDAARGDVRTFGTLTSAFAIGSLTALGVAAYFVAFPAYAADAEELAPSASVRVSAGWGSIGVDAAF